MLERIVRWLLVGMFCASAATCGQKGPLELPEPQAKVVGDGLVPSRSRMIVVNVAGDDKRIAGDDKRIAGDDKRIAGDDKRIAGDGAPLRARQRRPYEVPPHRPSAWSTLGEGHGIRA